MNKGLKALKKASPEAYAKIMGMDKKELTKMADKGIKVLRQYFSGGVVPHAVYSPIGMQAHHRSGLQNFVNAAGNLPTPGKKEEKIKTPKPEDMKEMSSMTIAEVPGAMDNDGLRASGAAPGLMTGGPSAGPATMTIPRSGTGGSGMGQLEMGDGVKVMKDGGLYAENGKKNGEDEEENISSTEALRRLAAANPGRLVQGSTADTARPLGNLLDQPMGYTTAIDNTAVPIFGIDAFPGEPVQIEPEPTPTRPEGLSPMRTLKAGLPQSRLPRELMGGIREIQTPEGPTRVFSFSPIGGYGMTPESGNVAGSGSSGANYDPSRAGQPGGLHATVTDSRAQSGYNSLNMDLDDFYLPGATGVRDFDTSPFGVRTLPSGRQEVNMGSSVLDNAGKLNITDIYDIYGEDAYMSALGSLQKAGVDLDQFDLPVFFDRPSRYGSQGSSKALSETYTPTQGDILKSRASRSVDGRVVSGTGRLGDPALMGGTGKRAKQGTDAVARSGRELLDYFARQAQFAKEKYGPNSPEAKQAEDLIAENFGSGGKMYGGGGMRALKSYGYGGKY